MFTLLKILSKVVGGFVLCWLVVYLTIAFPRGATPVDVLTSYGQEDGGFFIVLWASLVLYAVLSALYIFIRSYKQ